jgi:hypothetical protein
LTHFFGNFLPFLPSATTVYSFLFVFLYSFLQEKENQANLSEAEDRIFAAFEDSQHKTYEFDYDKIVDKDRRRIEIRECWTISDLEVLRHWRGFANGKNLLAVSRIRSQPWIGVQKSSEDREHIALSLLSRSAQRHPEAQTGNHRCTDKHR